MWIEQYNELKDIEKERFAQVFSLLLNKSFLVREIYESNNKIAKINPDYRFLEKYLDVFENFFKIIGYQLNYNDINGYYFLDNKYGYNRLRLDKLTTLILLVLRTIYDDEKEKNATTKGVYLTVGSLVYKLLDMQLVNKKPTIKELTYTLRLLINHNIISKIEGNIEDSNCVLVILPSILEIVSNDKINYIYNMVFGEEFNESPNLFKKKKENLEDDGDESNYQDEEIFKL